MDHPLLWHFTFSHYAEKVRWALDWKNIPHVRRRMLPGLHYPRVLWATGQPTVPVLWLDGKPIADSTRIIAALEQGFPAPPLYPLDERERRRALELEEFFDEELGHPLRRVLMQEAFTAPDAAEQGAAVFATGYGPGVRRALRVSFPATRSFLRWRYGIASASAAASRAKVVAALDRIEAELGPSGYLAGERFSIADLTAAALFSPLVQPLEFPYPYRLQAAGGFRASLAGRRAFRWIAEMYRRHRGTSVEVAA
jgi:glutathione S-transferase